jgi:hypothetical protein
MWILVLFHGVTTLSIKGFFARLSKTMICIMLNVVLFIGMLKCRGALFQQPQIFAPSSVCLSVCPSVCQSVCLSLCFSAPVLIRHLWKLKTAVFLQYVLFRCYNYGVSGVFRLSVRSKYHHIKLLSEVALSLSAVYFCVIAESWRRQATRHNDIQHLDISISEKHIGIQPNDIQHNRKTWHAAEATDFRMSLRRVSHVYWHADCRYAECRYAECHGAALVTMLSEFCYPRRLIHWDPFDHRHLLAPML